MTPLVSAIVLNYRSYKDTTKCVQALLNQTIGDRLEILIVDNHSDDESIGVMRARYTGHPGIHIIESPTNSGYAHGNNLAARYAKGQYLLIINPDNILPPDAAEKLVTILKNNPDAGIIGPALIYPDNSIRPSARSFPTMGDLIRKRLKPDEWHSTYQSTIDRSKNIVEVDWLVGACLLIEKKFFDTLGGFDQRFFLFFEDIDLCRRCWGMGKKVLYAPAIRVQDRKRRLSEGGIFALFTKPTTRIHLKSAVKYFYKWKAEMAEKKGKAERYS